MIKFEPWLHYKCTTTNVHQIDFNDCISQIIHDYIMSHKTVACQLIAVLAWATNPRKIIVKEFTDTMTHHLLPWTCASRPSSTALTTIPSPLPSTDKPDNILIQVDEFYNSKLSMIPGSHSLVSKISISIMDSIWSRHMTLHLLRTLLPNQINTFKEITEATNKSKVLK